MEYSGEERDIDSILDEEVFGKRLENLPVVESILDEVGFSDRISDLLGERYK